MRIKLFLLFLLPLLQSGTKAQSISDPVFHTLEAEVLGIRSAIYQSWDSRGRLWAISDQGLLYFNGYQSKLISADSSDQNSPLSDNLRTLYEIKTDEFWLRYRDSHSISKFDPVKNTFQHFYPDSLNPHAIPNIDLAKILFDTDSTRWLLTWGEGLCRLNIKNGYAVYYKNDDDVISEGEPPVNFIKDLVKINEDLFLVAFFMESDFATPYYFTPSTGKFTPFDFVPYFEKLDERMLYLITKALTIINFVHIDAQDNFWFGTYMGLLYLNQKEKTIQRISHESNDLYRQNLENTRTCIADANGILWITTPNQGLILVNPLTQEIKYVKHSITSHSGISDNRLSTIKADPSGNIWIATEDGAFSICNPFVQKFQIHPWSSMKLDFSNRSFQEIPVNQILVEPNGTVLISNQTGLVEYNSKTRTITKNYTPPNQSSIKGENRIKIDHFRKKGNTIFFILQTRQGNGDVAVKLDYTTNKLEIPDSRFRAHYLLFRHSDPTQDIPVVYYNYWGPDRLLIYNEKTNKLDSLARLPHNVNVNDKFTLILNSGRWMFPADSGRFVLFDPVDLKMEIYSSKSDLNYFQDSTINCAYKDDQGLVWIGTQTGIYLFDEIKNTITKQNQILGLPDNETINAITQDKLGVLWIALSKELLRWDQKNKERFIFNKSHGLRVGNFLPAVAQQDSAGNIYTATYNGILIFNPIELQIPKHPFEIYLSGAFLHDSLLNSDNVISGKKIFSNNENYLTFEFYTNQLFTLTPTRFFYKLAGRDAGWQDNGISNRIRLADLSYGIYNLEIKAINSFGQESNVLQIPITIDKPYYLKWWFISFVSVALIVLIWIFIRYREKSLRKKSIALEKIVDERTADVVREKKEADKQRLEAEHQKEIVEEKQKEISDSINYAKRIQNAILPSNRFFQNHLPDSFILYLPKDIVAGDFYFMEVSGDTIILAVADCTGHGVPGAMVSVVCHNALTRSVKEFGLTMPNDILDKTRELVLETFEKSEDKVNDGMDIAICSINKKTNTLYFSGANNGLFLMRNNELLEFKPDKQPIGKFINARPFTSQQISIAENDRFFLYTDGYADQFGGEAGKPGGKKFKYSRLKTLLKEIYNQSFEHQKTGLTTTLENWRGDIEQIDDVCIIGFRVI